MASGTLVVAILQTSGRDNSLATTYMGALLYTVAGLACMLPCSVVLPKYFVISLVYLPKNKWRVMNQIYTLDLRLISGYICTPRLTRGNDYVRMCIV